MLQGTVRAGHNFPDSAVVDQLFRFSKFGVEAVRHPDVQYAPTGFGSPEHEIRLFEIDSDRLLDQHMLAACERLESNLAMQIRGKAYADGIDLASKEVLIIRVTPDVCRQISETVW